MIAIAVWVPVVESELLLTVDSSAHASMKNTANCNTQCELQNYRVFECKWRSRFHREHVCLSIRLNCTAKFFPLCGWLRHEVSSLVGVPWSDGDLPAFGIGTGVSDKLGIHTGVDLWCGSSIEAALCSESQIRWDHPLNLSISISGENKDSPSNCERSRNTCHVVNGLHIYR